MKKCVIPAFVLACTFALLGCNHRSMDYIIANEPSIPGIVQEVRDNTIIIYAETDDYPNGTTCEVSLDVENTDSYTDLSVGDEVVVYYNGDMTEGDPLQIETVYAITLRTPAKENSYNRQQGDSPMQYFFSGQIVTTEEEYLLIEVNDAGNSNLPDSCTVEVSKKVTRSDERSDFSVGDFVKVLMAQSVKEDPPGRLEALSIYEVDEAGGMMAATTQHDLSKDGDLQVSATADGDDPFMVADAISTNSEKISITNHCDSQINARLFADTDLAAAIRELVIDSGKTASFTGLTSRFFYRVALSSDESGAIDATIEE